MRILLANHTSAYSGAEESLLRVVAGLRAEHDVGVACPRRAAGRRRSTARASSACALPAVDASLRLHPVLTPLGVAQLAAGGVALARAARRFRADVIHANTPRMGLMGADRPRPRGRRRSSCAPTSTSR